MNLICLGDRWESNTSGGGGGGGGGGGNKDVYDWSESSRRDDYDNR